jgi:choline transport protein
MNYNSVILVGVLFLTTVWWFIHGRSNYPGPKLANIYLISGVDPKPE